jgi:hypothetical protein
MIMILQLLPRLAISLLLAGFLIGCSSAPEVAYDQKVDFKPPKTFTWLDDSPLKYSQTDYKVSSFLETHLMEATKSQLESKGYRYVSMSEGPDFAVAFTFGAREKIQKSRYPSGYTMASAAPGASSFHGPGAVQTTKYVEGQIFVDFFAESTKSLAWQISDSGKLEEMSGEELRQAVNELMANLLSDFPPEG